MVQLPALWAVEMKIDKNIIFSSVDDEMNTIANGTENNNLKYKFK